MGGYDIFKKEEEIARLLSNIRNNREGSTSDIHTAKIAMLYEILKSLQGGLRHFSSIGVWVDVKAHLDINRAVVQNAQCYFQIQPNLMLGPDLWTSEWRTFLKELKEVSFSRRYIFAGKAQEYEENRENINAAKLELEEHGFYVGYCATDGYDFEVRHPFYKNAVVEFFGRELVKILIPHGDRYVGSERSILILTDQESDPECNYFMNYVDQHESQI